VPERDGYIPGVPCWNDTSHADPKAAAAFYGDLLGWELEDVMPPDAPGSYFMARLRGGDVAAIGSQPEGGPPTAVWNTYVWVDSADATAAKVREAGGGVLAGPFDVMDAGRMAAFTDPEGAAFCVWEPKRHRGARIVNEPGSCVFNVLATRDLDGAKSFYGSVFGWELLDVGGAGMWRLRGYGDHLEQSDPELRKRMADAGGPDGFEDVVASVRTTAADEPPRWSVTFGVESADAAADRAAELGGRVVSPPTDAPWSRTTVIADPQGATFIASQFAPENREVEAGSSVSAA